MKISARRVLSQVLVSTFLAIAVSGMAAVGVCTARQPSQAKDEKPIKPFVANRLTIEVTGGEKNAPIDNASVYIKFVQERLLKKDKKHEMNVKTNADGVAHVPDAPTGKVLIQVVAEGWKPFGRWYEIEDLSQPIQIRLERPKHWY
jgi:hypothetical protein